MMGDVIRINPNVDEPLNINERELLNRFLRQRANAGKKGGQSRSEKKREAARRTLAKVRRRRWDPEARIEPSTKATEVRSAVPSRPGPYTGDTPLPDYIPDAVDD